MKKIRIKITEDCGCSAVAPSPAVSTRAPDAHTGEEARMHRTSLAMMISDARMLLDMIEDEDDLPEWVESKITKASDYVSKVVRYLAGNEARDKGLL